MKLEKLKRKQNLRYIKSSVNWKAIEYPDFNK